MSGQFAPKYSDKVKQKVLRKFKEGAAVRALSKEFTIPRSTIRSWITEAGIEQEAQPAPSPKRQPANFDWQMEQFLLYIGKTQANLPTKKPSPELCENYLVITDVHVPYHNLTKLMSVTAEFLDEFGNGHLIIGGDFLDGYSLNSFGKEKESSFKAELAAGRVLLEWFASQFETVTVVDDNHVTGRFRRWLYKQVPPDLHFLISDPYDYLVEGLPNVKHAGRTFKNGANLGWLYQFGDAIVAHAEVSSSIPLRPVSRVSDWLDSWSKPLGLGDVRLVIEAHVHKGGSYYMPGKDRLLIESGCMASYEAVGYSMGPDLKGKPLVTGAVFVVQNDGITDIKKSRFVYLG